MKTKQSKAADLKNEKPWVQMCDDAEHACACVTFLASNSDVCLYVSVAREHVAVGAALGLLLWLTGGQHVGRGGRLFR